MLPFVLVTGNPNKLREAERILGYRPEMLDVDLPEIQSLSLSEVLQAKVEEAYRRIQRPVVVEETGLALMAMNGFPGPLIKWMLDAMSAEGVARSAIALGDPGAIVTCALAYHDGERTLSADGETRGHLVAEARGGEGFGWDPVFVPEGHQQTYAELSAEAKDAVSHRGRAWRAFRQVLAGAKCTNQRGLANP